MCSLILYQLWSCFWQLATTSTPTRQVRSSLTSDTAKTLCTCLHKQPYWLLQQLAVRCQWRHAEEATSTSERSCSGGDGSTKVRPRHAGASWTSLASSPSENQVKADDDSLQVPTRIGADVLGWDCLAISANPLLASDTCGPLAPGYWQYQGQGPLWGWGVSRSQVPSSETVYQPPCDPQLYPLWRSLDIWRPTCPADRQCV